jgi:small conductance mechanosensitive channel
MLAVPNTEVINKTVASYTNFPHLRLDIPVTIGVNEDIQHTRRVLLDLVQDNPDFLNEPPARVVTQKLNDYNVQIELQAWIRDERQHVEMRSELREMVFNALNQAGVDMPFETIRHLPLEVSLSQS